MPGRRTPPPMRNRRRLGRQVARAPEPRRRNGASIRTVTRTVTTAAPPYMTRLNVWIESAIGPAGVSADCRPEQPHIAARQATIRTSRPARPSPVLDTPVLGGGGDAPLIVILAQPLVPPQP